MDLAYATTGHRAQGLTRWRALVRLTGAEDANWLYVQLSRARHQTTLYPVVGPEPQGPAELDLPDREVGDGYAQLAQALSRAGDQTLAIDTQSSLDLRRVSTRELRAERDRLRGLLGQAPRNRARELQRARARRAEADQALTQLTTSSDPQRDGRGCFACPGGPGRPRPTRPPPWWPASRPTGPTTTSWPCAASSSAGPAGWRPTPTSAPPTGRWSGSWPGSAAPAAWPPSTNHPPTFARSSARCRRRPRGRRAWRQAVAAIEDYRRSHQVTDPDHAWARRRASRPSGPPGSTPARQSPRIRGRQRRPDRDRQPQPGAASRPSPVDRHQQNQALARAGRDAPLRRSGPERAAGWHHKEAAMARQPDPHPDGVWSSCDDQQPGVSIRPLSQADLAALLAHLHHHQDRDHILRSGRSAPVVAVRVRASVGRPGASAQGEYQRRRATELATWARSLPWRVAAVVAAGVAAGLAAARVAPDLAAPTGVTVAAGLGWLLGFRTAPDTMAWRRGAAGERRTARLLAPLERHGWVVLHDLAIPGSAANIDCDDPERGGRGEV